MLVDDGNHLKIIDFGSAQSFIPGQPLSIEHIHGFAESKGISNMFIFAVSQRNRVFTILTIFHIIQSEHYQLGYNGKYVSLSSSVYIVLPKAPEILEGQGVGPETDIWAIGVLAFIM